MRLVLPCGASPPVMNTHAPALSYFQHALHAPSPFRRRLPQAPRFERSVGCCSVSRRDVLHTACWLSVVDQLTVGGARAAYVDEASATAVFSAASRSVVAVEDYVTDGSNGQIQEGVGSGFVWDTYGHIVTNYHCVAKLARDQSGKQRTYIATYAENGEQSRYEATIVGTDPQHDLAVLSIDAPAEELVPVKIGTSADLKVGQAVFAIGNPSGLSKTQTSGVVSGLRRTIPSPVGTRIGGAIQTDASINAGNSGGPLLDSFGRVIGINTATFTKQGTGRGSGVNFALPVDLVLEIVPRLIVYGQASERRV